MNGKYKTNRSSYEARTHTQQQHHHIRDAHFRRAHVYFVHILPLFGFGTERERNDGKTHLHWTMVCMKYGLVACNSRNVLHALR